jgi:sugar phosphate isomerase/epimerase
MDKKGIKIAIFPKGYIDELCDGRMSLFEWIEMAGTLGADGLELYPPFLVDTGSVYLQKIKIEAEKQRLLIPMMCSSPDFTHPDPAFRQHEIEKMKTMIDVMEFLGPPSFRSCRVLSGQNRPEITKEEGIRWTVECIQELLPYAASKKVYLVMENHYKDGFWIYPEFAQAHQLFIEIIQQIVSPWFGVNFDPSNAVFAGEDPIWVMAELKHRILTMHASDRYLKEGYKLEDIKHFTQTGYSQAMSHGVIGKGVIDYHKVFEQLQSIKFSNWISIEDGVNGLGDLKDSVKFLRNKVNEYNK